ncbi:MAG: hypothetical protein ACI8P0_000916 [Planctomycetaceae bacterium]|jgi:hypothetical protein
MNAPPFKFAVWLRSSLLLTTAALIMLNSSGCSLLVMGGKMLFGDPKVASSFKTQTGVDLTDGEKSLLVVCRSPHLILNEAPTFEYDLTDGLLRRLKQKGVKVVSPDKVSRWLDDNGGEFDDVKELARDFDADFIAVVDVQSVRFFEENSKDMLKGHAQGTIRVHESTTIGGERTAYEAFRSGFSLEHPRFRPVSIHEMSAHAFQRQFIDTLTRQIARQFHDYQTTDEF